MAKDRPSSSQLPAPHSPLQRLIVQSIAAAVFTIGVKAAAYFITGSVGLLADALESGLNFVAAVTAYFSLWYAARPIDPTHTYGHEKIEFFSAGLEGVLIVVAAIGIGFIAIRRLITPEPLESIGLRRTHRLGGRHGESCSRHVASSRWTPLPFDHFAGRWTASPH